VRRLVAQGGDWERVVGDESGLPSTCRPPSDVDKALRPIQYRGSQRRNAVNVFPLKRMGILSVRG
jgi:hypothetical protein